MPHSRLRITLAAALTFLALGPLSPVAADAEAGRHSGLRSHGKIFKHAGHLGHRNFGHRGFSRSFNRGSFNRNFSGSFGRGFSSSRRSGGLVFQSGFQSGFHGGVSPRHFSQPHRVVIIEGSTGGEYAAPPQPTLADGWALLGAGRYTQAQQLFGGLAAANPTEAAPKIGFGLAAALRGQFDAGERALRRGHDADDGVWAQLRRQPQARAAAADLLALPQVQASKALRTAMDLLTEPIQDAGSDDKAPHDYDVAS